MAALVLNGLIEYNHVYLGTVPHLDSGLDLYVYTCIEEIKHHSPFPTQFSLSLSHTHTHTQYAGDDAVSKKESKCNSCVFVKR